MHQLISLRLPRNHKNQPRPLQNIQNQAQLSIRYLFKPRILQLAQKLHRGFQRPCEIFIREQIQ